MVELGKANS